MLDHLGNNEAVRIGGAGNKLSKVALGKADAYIYGSAGPCLWDVSPGEVLVKGMGGFVTDINLNKYNYRTDVKPVIQGVFATRSYQHYQ